MVLAEPLAVWAERPALALLCPLTVVVVAALPVVPLQVEAEEAGQHPPEVAQHRTVVPKAATQILPCRQRAVQPRGLAEQVDMEAEAEAPQRPGRPVLAVALILEVVVAEEVPTRARPPLGGIAITGEEAAAARTKPEAVRPGAQALWEALVALGTLTVLLPEVAVARMETVEPAASE